MTKNNYLTTILAMTVLVTVVGTSQLQPADAVHNWFQPKWATSSHTYDCLSSLNNLSTSYINTCDDLQNAADVWNNVVNSDWDLNESGSGEIPIGSQNLATGTIALTTTWVTGSTVTQNQLDFNTDHTFTDSNIATSGYDYESIAVHEIGHSLHLNEEYVNSSSPMYYTIGEDTVRRTLAQHDIDVIRDMY